MVSEKCINSVFGWNTILSFKEIISIIRLLVLVWFISDIKGYFCGAEIFQLFLSAGN